MRKTAPSAPVWKVGLLLVLACAASACSGPREAATPLRPDARPGLVADSAAAARRGYLAGFPALQERGDLAHAVVEIPAGTSAKWMVDHDTGRLVWERRPGGERRVVQYLAYPVNYGIVPGTLGGDGDPLDVLVLGPALPRGSVWAVRPVGVLRLTDDGERDDKILAVRPGAPLGDATGLAALRRQYPGITQILETWFTRYKGAAGDLRSGGYGDGAEARRIIRQAAAAFGE